MDEREPVDFSKAIVLGETGLDRDSINAWMLARMQSVNGKFDEIQPVLHYGQYFQQQDRKWAEAGKPGLFKATMEASNPDAVAAFDQLVDEFNADLPRIKAEKDGEIIKGFVDRYMALHQKPAEDTTPK